MKRWILCCALLAGVIAGVGGLVAEWRARAGAEASATVSIPVEVSFQEGPTTPGAIERHVTGGTQATIEARGLSLAATTDENGHAELSKIPVSSDMQSEPAKIDVVITAPGYGTFTYLNVPLTPELGIILTPILGPEPRTDDLGRLAPPLSNATPSATPSATTSATPDAAPTAAPSATTDAAPDETPNATPSATPDATASAVPNAAASEPMDLSAPDASCPPPDSVVVGTDLGSSSCDGYASTTSPPPTINVYFNFLQEGTPDCQIHQVMFKNYVKQVLPNEWYASWNYESLKAGAVAVKMYGWERKLFWKRWVNGSCASVDSGEVSQVWTPSWDPYVQSAPTNQAVEETWGYRLMRADGLQPYVYEALHQDGDPSDSCTTVPPQLDGAPAPGDTMSQWGSKACGDPPNNWYWWQILAAYYYDPQSSLVFGCPGDSDCDGVPEGQDNCSTVYNPVQTNTDGGRRPNGTIPGNWASNPAQDGLGTTATATTTTTGCWTAERIQLRACQAKTRAAAQAPPTRWPQTRTAIRS